MIDQRTTRLGLILILTAVVAGSRFALHRGQNRSRTNTPLPAARTGAATGPHASSHPYHSPAFTPAPTSPSSAATPPAMPTPAATAAPTNALPSAPYDTARIIAERESAPDVNGAWIRTRLLEIDNKYPYIRVEETRRHDPAHGTPVTVMRVAMVADHILVRLHPQATEAMLNRLNQRYGATIRRRMKRDRHYIIAFDTFDIETVTQRIRDYRASPWITDVAEPDYLVEPTDTTPNDPRLGELWGMARIGAPPAWDLETGNGAIVVGVIDSGVDYTHEDLADNIWINPFENPTNGIDDDANGYIDDVYGWDFGNDDAIPFGPPTHGTHVAGTVAAVGNNSTGVVGVAWNTRIMILKMFSDTGIGETSDAIDALDYARAMREQGVPIRITNNSWGGGGYSSLLKSAIADTGDAGMLFIAAAGNYAWNNDLTAFYPATYDLDNILSVAASTSSDQLAYFSHYGPTTVDLAAPGVSILSTVPGGYALNEGTSMASPHVAGACALLWEAYPEATWPQIRDFIMAGVDTNAYLLGRMVSGGRLNVSNALYAIAPVIMHDPHLNTTNTTTAYRIDATVEPLRLLVPGSVQLHWNTQGPAYPYTAVGMVRITNNLYRAAIPAQPLGQQIYYYLEAQTRTGLTQTDPASAPSTPHHFEVTDAVQLWITGYPGERGNVTPAYGIHTLAKGNTITATADLLNDVTTEHRYACVGWAGLGDVPATGTTNRVTFVLNSLSALSWSWDYQYSLTQTALPGGVVDTVTWWTADSTGQTVTAPDPVTISTSDYRFVAWEIDGQRWPDATNSAANPATLIHMSAARQAVARYLPDHEDTDLDHLPDWWELRYFGDLDSVTDGDPDGDGFTNAEELADGTDPRDSGSCPQPPVINHTPLPDPQMTPAPWPITATVCDNFSVASATLYWRNVTDAWHQTPMTPGTGDIYTATIPGPGVLNERFEYRLEAVDGAGWTNTTPVYAFDVIYGVFSFTPSNSRLLMEPNTFTERTVTLMNSGNTGLTWTADAGWMDRVEQGNSGVTHSGDNDLWHISTNRAYSGTHAWYCGDPAQRVYLNKVNASLQLPPVFPTDNTLLTFQYWADIEYDQTRQDDHYWDGGIVEASTNGGVSFVQITPVGGYPHRITPNDQSPFPYDTPCYGGNGEGWHEATFDLSAYANQVVHLRFRFGSDWAAVEEGWYIDDIAVIFPSPSVGWLNLHPTSGTLAVGESSIVTVRLDSAQMSTGNLTGRIRLNVDDPVNPVNYATIDLAVQSAADLAFLSASGGGLSASNGVLVFEWMGTANRFYTLYERTSLVNQAEEWLPVPGASDIPGLNGSMSHTVNVERVTQRFYRLTVY